jgi:hypothetical protein
VRIALLFPRVATVDNVLLKAVQVYNSYELACASATTATTGSGGGGGDGGDSVGDVSGTVSAMDGDGSAHQHQHQQQGTDRAKAAAGAEAGAAAGLDSADSTNTATTGEVQRPGAGEGLVSPANTSVVISPQQQYPAVRLSEPPRLPQLLVANAVLIDVNDKAKGRFGKMLDKKYVLHSFALLC